MITLYLTIQLNDKLGYPTKEEIIEWLEWRLGQESDISAGNPLMEFELSDCDVNLNNVIVWPCQEKIV